MKNNEILPLARWMDLEGTMLNELVKLRNTNTLGFPLHMESKKKNKYTNKTKIDINTDNGLVAIIAGMVGKTVNEIKRYKCQIIKQSQGLNYSIKDRANNIIIPWCGDRCQTYHENLIMYIIIESP